MDNIEKLYQYYEVLNDAKDKIKEHGKEFSEIINAVKGSANEKKLASQFIAKFFKHFRESGEEAINAMLDLCEDEDVTIRKQAIKDLSTLCKDSKEYVPKISFALAQILQSEDSSEISIVYNSVATLFQIDALGTMAGLFSEINEGDELVREKTLKLLAHKLKNMGPDVLTREVQQVMVSECKKVLTDVTADEFVLIMLILGHCKISETVSGQQQLVDLIADQCNFSQPFNPSDQDNIERIIMCMKHAIPFFSTQVRSTAFVSYMCEQVLPRCEEMGPKEGSEHKLDFFKLLAELSSTCGALDNPEEKLEKLYQTLLGYMPLPVISESNGNGEAAPEEEPRLEFTYVESLMYAFHQLARQSADFLAGNADRLKDFRLRLQYFARGVQGYMKKLRESLHEKKGDELKDDESRIKVTALRTTSNINILIRDLFRNPPIYKASVGLSFKPPQATQAAKLAATAAVQDTETAAAGKRHAPITFENSPPKQGRAQQANRGNWQPYSVPTGKFSAKVSHGTSAADSRPRGRGNFRGGRGGGGFRRTGY